MNSTFILIPSEYEKSKDEEYPAELSRKNINMKDNYFQNCLLSFMMLHDLRELLLNNESYNKGKPSVKLIKDEFPLLCKSNEITEFEINKEYNLDKINITKIYRKTVSYKNSKSENFEQGELVIYNKHLYFCTIIQENTVKINLKYILKYVGVYKERNDNNNEINLLMQKSQIFDEDNSVGNNFNVNDDEKEIIIVIKFEDEDTKKETAQKITDKILSINNDERLIFDGYFKEIINSMKQIEEDF